MQLHRVASATLAATLTLVACGGGASEPTATGPTATGPTATEPTATGPTATEPTASGAGDPAPASASSLPDLDVVDLASGENVNLASLPAQAAGRPIVLWFWAPH